MRRLISAVVVALLLAVAADRVADYLVQNRLANQIESEEGVDGVHVDISGFPFLTQVAQNHFDEVKVSLPTLDADTAAGRVQVEDVDVTLRDVETSHQYTRASAESATGSAFIPYDAFDQFDDITVEYGGEASDGRTYIDVSVPSLSDEKIRVLPDVADGLTFDLGTLERVRQSLPPPLQTFLSRPYGLTGLPSGITIDDITATQDGLALTVTGTDVSIAG